MTEWIEPEEAARERCAEVKRKLPRLALFCFCAALTSALATPLMLLSFDVHLSSSPGVTGGLWCGAMGSGFWVFRSLAWLSTDSTQSSYALDEAAVCVKRERASWKYLWTQVRSYGIADHPALSELRRLTIYGQRGSQLHLDFCVGQLDEAELRAFIESRIVEQRTRRLTRRVKT